MTRYIGTLLLADICMQLVGCARQRYILLDGQNFVRKYADGRCGYRVTQIAAIGAAWIGVDELESSACSLEPDALARERIEI